MALISDRDKLYSDFALAFYTSFLPYIYNFVFLFFPNTYSRSIWDAQFSMFPQELLFGVTFYRTIIKVLKYL